jgi:hypothetical protein
MSRQTPIECPNVRPDLNAPVTPPNVRPDPKADGHEIKIQQHRQQSSTLPH